MEQLGNPRAFLNSAHADRMSVPGSSTDLTTPKFDFRSSLGSGFKSESRKRLAVTDPGSWRRSLMACCLATSSSRWSSGRRATSTLTSGRSCGGVIDLIQVNAKGAELGPVLETIENALRADQAKLIEAE
jgi:hypothetical protein